MLISFDPPIFMVFFIEHHCVKISAVDSLLCKENVYIHISLMGMEKLEEC